MNVIFMGTPDYAEKILAKLIENKNINIVAVYTQPDKPVGRKKVITSPEVKNLAKSKNITVYQPNRLRDSEVVSELLKIECDYIVVAAYGQILPRAILDHAPCINLHASILPQYRGASPIQQTLLNNDAITGVTAMLMEEGLDTGDILKIDTMNVPKDMMLESLFTSLTKIATLLTIDVLENFEKLIPKKQNDEESSHCKKIIKKDGLVTFNNSSQLYNKYRAFTPWPGIFLESGTKLKKMELVEKSITGESGKILEVNTNNILVSCSVGIVKIYTVQPVSKKEMSVISYINGKRLTIDDTFI